jgi:hypothetical protein
MIVSLGPKLATATLARRARFGSAADYQHYRHTATGAQLTAPFGTSFLGDYASSDNGELAVFGGQMAVFGGHQYTASVWLKAEPRAAGELAALARVDIEGKAAQREELEGWQVRSDSIRTGGGPDRQWVHAMAEYTDGGRKMAELMTAYRTTKNVAFFFTRVPADRAPEYQGYLVRMVELAVIP